MTHLIGGVMLLAILVLGWRSQVLELRNAQLTSALVAARSAAADGEVCRDIVRAAEGGDYVGTLQAATKMAERHAPHAQTRR